VQAPAESNWSKYKLAIEVAAVILACLLACVCGCCNIRWNSKKKTLRLESRTRHTQSQDIAYQHTEVEAYRSHHEHETGSNHSGDDDWTVDQIIRESLGLGNATPETPIMASNDVPEDVIPKYIDTYYSSWKLLFSMMLTLGQFWAALAWMYFSLLQDTGDMMDCEAYPKNADYHLLVLHGCHYTRACLHGFPVIAANMALVLMLRTLMQHRLYYSMLRSGYLMVFQGIPVLQTFWPLATGLSMAQGALHFVIKAYFVPNADSVFMILTVTRKFLLPGAIFFMILFRYADVENTLVPLNHLAELECNENQHHSPWLTRLLIMNERVVAFDVRHRDVLAEIMLKLERTPTLDDVFVNVIDHYDSAKEQWHARVHKQWGLFRSMWPASLLMDDRLDKSDKPTRTWLYTIGILLAGCVITSLGSVYLLLAHTDHISWIAFVGDFKTLFTAGYVSDSGHVLVNLVVLWHAGLVVVFLHHAIHNMWYQKFSHEEVQAATKSKDGARSSAQ
jgi:hypothetical protein